MNNARREAIRALITKIEAITNAVEEIQAELEGLRDEEQDYFDAMPESFQNGEKGEVAQNAIDQLNEAYDAFDNLDIDAITSALEAATE